jgi:electron transfer flavoprotein alpha subunit
MILVLVEHDGRQLKKSSLAAVGLAIQLKEDYAFLLIGSCVAGMVPSLQGLGAATILVADHPTLAAPLADRYSAIVAQVAARVEVGTVLGTASTFTKDVLPRAAALLDAPMVSDVTGVEAKDGEVLYLRPASAGSVCQTIRLEGGGVRVLTARGTAFHAPAPNSSSCPEQNFEFEPASLPAGTEYVSREQPASSRPELTEARVVVSGGRPLRDGETFERLVGGLADALGGAIGATRAAVDAGMAPNQCQVGQTAKTVAPELYIAVGVSGAIQHVAGMRDARVIVAINRDPDAPIFEVANYGLVGDLHQIVPQLIAAVRG